MIEPQVRTKIYKMILRLVRFPFPQICRHSVACDLLSLMESEGEELNDDLVTAIVASSNGDETAERILIDILSGKET